MPLFFRLGKYMICFLLDNTAGTRDLFYTKMLVPYISSRKIRILGSCNAKLLY